MKAILLSVLASLVWTSAALAKNVETTVYPYRQLNMGLQRMGQLQLTEYGGEPRQVFVLPFDKAEVTSSNCSLPDQALALFIADTLDYKNTLLGLMCVPASQCKTLVKNDRAGIKKGYETAWYQAPIIKAAHSPGLFEILIYGPYAPNNGEVRGNVDGSSTCISEDL